MNTPEELQELVQKAQQGDSSAFSKLYNHYLTPIFRFVYFRVRSSEDAEDLSQHIFLKVWGALPEFGREGTSFSAWLYRIARNTVIDYWRKKKDIPLDPVSPIFHNQRDLSNDPNQQAALKEDAEFLRSSLHILKEDQQTVLTLKFLEGLSNAEIAEIMQKSEGAIRQIQSRALKVLRHHFKENPMP